MNSFIIAGNILKRAFRSKKELILLTLLPILIITMISLLIIESGGDGEIGESGIMVTYRVAGTQQGEDYEGTLTTLGFMITFIMVFAFIYMGNLMEDKRRLILARIFSYPVREWEIILGNLLGNLVLGLTQLVPILLVLKAIFGFSFDGRFLGLSMILMAFLVTSIGLGIGLSGIIRKFNPVLLIATIIVPSSVLGGAFIPASMMPELMDRAGYIVPQKWVMVALERVLQGAELGSIVIHLLIILAFGFAFATFGIKTLKPMGE